jgi:PAS domain S-box-containing protein
VPTRHPGWMQGPLANQVGAAGLHPLPHRLLTLLLDSIGEALIATDRKGRILYWNQYATRLYGYEANEVLGRSIYDINVPRTSKSQVRGIMRQVALGETRTGEFEVKRRSGEIFWAEVKSEPVTDGIGRLKAISSLSQDITQRKASQAEREALISQLAKASQLKDEFLGLVSHEMGSPVTTILGLSEVLTANNRHFDKESFTEALVEIRNAARRLSRIVKDLLTLSRAESEGRVELEPVSIAASIETISTEHRRHYPGRRLEVHLPADLPHVLAHRVYLEHILDNLLANAEKYSNPSEGIEIQGCQADALVLIEVLDRGIGIGEDERERIFDAFYRSPRTRSLPGIGLGLAVCKRLVEVQKGTIEVEPRPGGGSLFRIALHATAR